MKQMFPALSRSNSQKQLIDQLQIIYPKIKQEEILQYIHNDNQNSQTLQKIKSEICEFNNEKLLEHISKLSENQRNGFFVKFEEYEALQTSDVQFYKKQIELLQDKDEFQTQILEFLSANSVLDCFDTLKNWKNKISEMEELQLEIISKSEVLMSQNAQLKLQLNAEETNEELDIHALSSIFVTDQKQDLDDEIYQLKKQVKYYEDIQAHYIDSEKELVIVKQENNQLVQELDQFKEIRDDFIQKLRQILKVDEQCEDQDILDQLQLQLDKEQSLAQDSSQLEETSLEIENLKKQYNDDQIKIKSILEQQNQLELELSSQQEENKILNEILDERNNFVDTLAKILQLDCSDDQILQNKIQDLISMTNQNSLQDSNNEQSMKVIQLEQFKSKIDQLFDIADDNQLLSFLQNLKLSQNKLINDINTVFKTEYDSTEILIFLKQQQQLQTKLDQSIVSEDQLRSEILICLQALSADSITDFNLKIVQLLQNQEIYTQIAQLLNSDNLSIIKQITDLMSSNQQCELCKDLGNQISILQTTCDNNSTIIENNYNFINQILYMFNLNSESSLEDIVSFLKTNQQDFIQTRADFESTKESLIQNENFIQKLESNTENLQNSLTLSEKIKNTIQSEYDDLEEKLLTHFKSDNLDSLFTLNQNSNTELSNLNDQIQTFTENLNSLSTHLQITLNPANFNSQLTDFFTNLTNQIDALTSELTQKDQLNQEFLTENEQNLNSLQQINFVLNTKNTSEITNQIKSLQTNNEILTTIYQQLDLNSKDSIYNYIFHSKIFFDSFPNLTVKQICENASENEKIVSKLAELLRIERSEIDSEVGKMVSQMGAAVTKIGILQENQSSQEAQIRHLLSQIEEQKVEKQGMESQIQIENDKLLAYNKQLLEKNNFYTSQINELAYTIQRSEKSNSILNQSLVEVYQTILVLPKINDNYYGKIVEICAKIGNLSRNFAVLYQQGQERALYVNQLQQRFLALKSRAEGLLTEKDSLIKEKDGEIANITCIVQQYNNQREHDENQILQLQNENFLLQKEAEQVTSAAGAIRQSQRISQLEMENNDLKHLLNKQRPKDTFKSPELILRGFK